MVVTAVPDLQAPVTAVVPSETLADQQTVSHHHAQGSDGGESEYESADEEELGEEEEEEDDELLIMPDGNVLLGEDNKPLDDDEDRKNPQYIPKKGTFYEHDDRTAAEEDVEKPPEEPVVKKEASKKKVWKEDNKWNHDKFNEFDQSPKSREELIAVYGYDIRNEEGPPRARRRRRYGRGPNKYTRNWEDLDAYAKPVRGGTIGGGRGPGRGNRSLSGSKKALYNNEEFPALNAPQHQKPGETNDVISRDSHSPKLDNLRAALEDQLIIDNDASRHQHQSSVAYQQQHHQQYQHHQNKNSAMSPQMQDAKSDYHGGRGRGGRGRGRGGGRGSNRDQQRYNDERGLNNYDSYSGGRGNRGGGGYQPKGPSVHQTHPDDITLEMKNINISSQNRDDRHKKNRGGGNTENRRNTVPPRLQESAAAAANLHSRGRGNSSPAGDGSASSRPKRYSSQRQRSIPDQPVPPFQQQPGYIDPSLDTGYQGGGGGGGGGFEGGVSPATSHTVTAPPQPPPSQHPLAGGAPPSFVPPAFTSPPTFPPEPFLGRPPAPRMFPPVPVTQSPHIFASGPPPLAGPPPLGAPPPVGAPPVPTGPPVTGPPFIPHEINYAAHPGPQPGPHTGPLPGAAPLAGPPHPPQFPPFQGFTPGPVSQPGEIYSNGVTYYNTENQVHLPRTIVPLQKRPKAAIPIVPPPERESKHGESSQGIDNQEEQQFHEVSDSIEYAPQTEEDQEYEDVPEDIPTSNENVQTALGTEMENEQTVLDDVVIEDDVLIEKEKPQVEQIREQSVDPVLNPHDTPLETTKSQDNTSAMASSEVESLPAIQEDKSSLSPQEPDRTSIDIDSNKNTAATSSPNSEEKSPSVEETKSDTAVEAS